MKKRLNGKLLLGISAVLAVLTWGVHSLHSFQVRRAAGALAERGIQAEQEGNLQEAARYLGRYLVYAPQDLPILEKYCAVLEKAGAPQQTQWQLLERLDEALRIRPDQPPLRRHAAYLAMDLQQYADARYHLETLLVANPEDVELEQTRARCLAALGAYDHAAATLENCARHEPHRIDTYILWAEMLSDRLDRPRDAKRAMDQMVAQNPKVYDAYVARARFLDRLARQLHERRRYREADQIIRKAPEIKDPSPDQAWLAADIAFHNRDFERSIKLARLAVPVDSGDFRSLLWLAQVLGAGGQRLEAEAILRRAAERNPQEPDAWITLVRFLLQSDQSEKALATMDEAARRLPADLVPFFRARCYEELGPPEKAAAFYREALMNRPKDRDLLLYAGNFYYRQDRPQDAEALLRQAVAAEGSINETCHARRRLARVLSAQASTQKREEALGLIRKNIEALGDTSEDTRLFAIIRGMDPESRRQAMADVAASTQKVPLSPEDQLSLAELHLADGDRPQFHELMLDLLARHNNNAWILASYIRTLLRQGESLEASRWLSRLEKREPRSPRTAQLELQLAELKRGKSKPAKSSAGRGWPPLIETLGSVQR